MIEGTHATTARAAIPSNTAAGAVEMSIHEIHESGETAHMAPLRSLSSPSMNLGLGTLGIGIANLFCVLSVIAQIAAERQIV